MRKTPVIVLDLETTGLSPYCESITEIAAARLIDGQIIDTFHRLVNPQRPIPRFITRLTGITDEMVKDAPAIADVLDDLRSFLGDDIIVAHNAGFDYKFLCHNFEQHKGFMLTNKTLCTAKLARRVHSDLPSKKLGALCQHYGIINEAAHRAMGDVKATVQVFNSMIKTLSDHEIETAQEVLHFTTLPVAKANRLLKDALMVDEF